MQQYDLWTNFSKVLQEANSGLTVKAFALAKHVGNVACHDGMHFAQVLCELGDVALRPCVHVELLCLADECVCKVRTQ